MNVERGAAKSTTTWKLAALLKGLTADEVPIVTGFLIRWVRQGRIGAGWVAAADAPSCPDATSLPRRALWRDSPTRSISFTPRGMSDRAIPSLYQWAGGMAALERLTEDFYTRVREDPDLAPVFARMSGDHPRHVAQFIAEVLGGPPVYSAEHGGHPHMVSRHLGRQLTEPQRRRWMQLLLDSADAVGLPDDPEFRSAFVGYLEWGTRLAVQNSQAGVEPVLDVPMPEWGWGPPGGPYRGESARED